MPDINRNIEAKIKILLKMFPVVAIIGVRQCGKTTLAQKICPVWKYVDMESARDYELISSDPNFFFSQYSDHVIIDEAQAYPDLFKTLRGVIDKKRNIKGRFLITGSSQPELVKHISESLAGRIAIVELAPLKTNEYAKNKISSFYDIFIAKLARNKIDLTWSINPKTNYQKLWLKGGFPEPVLQNNSEFYNFWISQFLNDYVFRDLSRLFPKLDKLKYRRFIRILANLSGSILNKSEIGRAVEANEGTIRDYFEIADQTFLWRMLYSYESSNAKSLVKMPKGYLRDSGMLHNMLNIATMDELFNHPIIGKSFEGFVTEELMRGISATTATNVSANYYRTRNGAEIDLILSGSFGVLPIEIKNGVTVKKKDLITIRQFVKEHNLPFGLVINQADKMEWLCEEILQLPVSVL